MFLQLAQYEDIEALHEMMCLPPVFRYLADGAPPPLSITQSWVDSSCKTAPRHGGLWILRSPQQDMCGCVRVVPYDDEDDSVGELTYVLHPDVWGKGYATQMSATIIDHLFANGFFARIIAGADQPNQSSIHVMQRLGMQFLREVDYPAGKGVEYVIAREDFQVPTNCLPIR